MKIEIQAAQRLVANDADAAGTIVQFLTKALGPGFNRLEENQGKTQIVRFSRKAVKSSMNTFMIEVILDVLMKRLSVEFIIELESWNKSWTIINRNPKSIIANLQKLATKAHEDLLSKKSRFSSKELEFTLAQLEAISTTRL